MSNVKYKHINMDKMRGALNLGDEDFIPEDTPIVLAMMRAARKACLDIGMIPILDGINIKKAWREEAIQEARDCDKAAVGILFDTNISTCLLRDALRTRRVGEKRIREMVTEFEYPDESEFDYLLTPYTYDPANIPEFPNISIVLIGIPGSGKTSWARKLITSKKQFKTLIDRSSE